MNAQILLHDLANLGVILSANGDQLDVDAPDELFTDELLATIRESKAELLELLANHCPVCYAPLREELGKQFKHVWCLTPGHLDSWRTMNGSTVGSTPLFKRLYDLADEEGKYRLEERAAIAEYDIHVQESFAEYKKREENPFDLIDAPPDDPDIPW